MITRVHQGRSVEARRQEWVMLRPRFEAFAFAFAMSDVERLTGLSHGTVYNLLNANTQIPHWRTIRDVRGAVEAWESDREVQD